MSQYASIFAKFENHKENFRLFVHPRHILNTLPELPFFLFQHHLWRWIIFSSFCNMKPCLNIFILSFTTPPAYFKTWNPLLILSEIFCRWVFARFFSFSNNLRVYKIWAIWKKFWNVYHFWSIFMTQFHLRNVFSLLSPLLLNFI